MDAFVLDLLMLCSKVKNNTKIFSLTKRLRWRNYFALFGVSIENLKNLKYHTFSKKHSFFFLFVVIVKMKRRVDFHWKYIINLKIWLKKTLAKSLDLNM